MLILLFMIFHSPRIHVNPFLLLTVPSLSQDAPQLLELLEGRGATEGVVGGQGSCSPFFWQGQEEVHVREIQFFFVWRSPVSGQN